MWNRIKMFRRIFEHVMLDINIEKGIRALCEGKTWEQIALALYQVLDDVDTAVHTTWTNDIAGLNVAIAALSAML